MGQWEYMIGLNGLFNQQTAALLASIQYADLLEVSAYYALTEPNELVEILSFDFDFPFSEAYLDGIDVEKCITAVDQKRMIPRIGKKIKKPKPKSNKEKRE